MPKAKKYKRLGRGSTLVQRVFLYDAHDHLLQVTGSFSEEYRRFYYRDIQAAFIRERKRLDLVLIICMAFLCIGTTAAYFAGADFLGLAVFLTFPTVILLLYGIPPLLRGGHCQFYVQTEIQNEHLYAIKSVSQAHKIIRLIRERTATPKTATTAEPTAPEPFDETPRSSSSQVASSDALPPRIHSS